MSTSGPLPPAGWHGKLPSRGDFVSRRIDGAFLSYWETSIAQGMHQLQQQPDWLQRYLEGPAWRYLIIGLSLPGHSQPTDWAGTLVPSVDCTNRYYPLTTTLPLRARSLNQSEWHALLRWQRRMIALCLDAIDDDWTPNDLHRQIIGLEGNEKMIGPESTENDSVDAPLLGTILTSAQIPAEPLVLWYRMASCSLVRPTAAQGTCPLDILFNMAS